MRGLPCQTPGGAVSFLNISSEAGTDGAVIVSVLVVVLIAGPIRLFVVPLVVIVLVIVVVLVIVIVVGLPLLLLRLLVLIQMHRRRLRMRHR